MSYYVNLQGLGDFAKGESGCEAKEGCTSSTQLPPGLVYKPPAGRPEMLLPPNKGYNEDLRLMCNASAAPAHCYFGKAYGKNFLGRGGPEDPQIWKNWVPSAPPASDSGTSIKASTAGDSNTLLYVGLGVSAVAVVGVIWYLKTR